MVNRLVMYAKIVKDNLVKEGCEFIMQKVDTVSGSIIIQFHRNNLPENIFGKAVEPLKCVHRIELGKDIVKILLQLYTKDQFMSYTTTELAELSGYTPATIIKLLEERVYKTLDIQHHGLKVWEDECLQILMDKRNTVIEKTTISMSTLSLKTKMSYPEIRKVLTDNGIEPLFTNVHRVEVFPYIALDVMQNYIADQKEDKADLHPLVTDKRCLKFTWFPDVVPKCFEDLDKEII